MNIQAWNVLGAPPVAWRPPIDANRWLAFSHVRTGVTDVGSDGCARGFTLWAGDLEGNPVFMAFDWVELRPGVPILTDPNAVLTNLSVIDDRDVREDRLKEVIHLNIMIRELGWQDVALGAARDYRNNPTQQVVTASHRRETASADRVESKPNTMRKAA